VTAGYSGTPLGRKLGIRPGALVALIGSPDGPARGIAQLLQSELHPTTLLRTDLRSRGPYDVIVAFVRSDPELRRLFERGRRKLDTAGGLWVSWPKQSSPLATELKERDVRAYGLSTGMVDNKVCAIDDDWSGLRFVIRLADRRP
jgi:hypothetical protein